MKENQKHLNHPVKVIAFKDEEGSRFGFGMIGSRAVAGKLTEADLEHEDDNGITINMKLYLEVHIEQGKVFAASRLNNSPEI